MNPAVRIEAIRYRYPGREPWALGGVSFDVQPGERFAVLGPNGCGKSTLFRLLATLLPLVEGRAAIFGHDVGRDRTAARRQMGVIFQQPSLDRELTSLENLTHHGRLYGLSGRDLQSRLAQAVERFDLADLQHQRVGRLSGGQQRRVELAKAMLHGPRLLLMDEPTVGLDPAVRASFWRTIDDLRAAAGLTVLLTTHLMDEADACDRVAILDVGKLVALDTPAALRHAAGRQVFTVHARPEHAADVRAELERLLPGVRLYPLPGARLPGAIRFEAERSPAWLAELAERLGDRVLHVGVGRPSLDDRFLQLTGHPLGAAGD